MSGYEQVSRAAATALCEVCAACSAEGADASLRMMGSAIVIGSGQPATASGVAILGELGAAAPGRGNSRCVIRPKEKIAADGIYRAYTQ